MRRSSRSDFDFVEYISLGREVSEKHEDFKILAPMGKTYARKRAILEYWLWRKKNPEATREDKTVKIVELLGEAEMLDEVKELGRMCLILGDTRPAQDWDEE